MALDLTAEQKAVGESNFNAAREGVGITRRGLLKGVAVAGAAAVPMSAALYFGYGTVKGKAVKAALIGCGDEGGVLLGEHNPEYIEFIAACDIRPFNKQRIIEGDPKVPLRKGFAKVYGQKYAHDIRDNHFYTDYREMLDKEKEIEAVVIALPLHLHAPVAIECMKRGKHVLCEKLMARTVAECKQMIEVAKSTKRILSIGHQRHYSVLYADCLDVVKSGVLGDIKHIRALWHRNFSWKWEPKSDEPAIQEGVVQPQIRDGWTPPIYQMDYKELIDKVGNVNDHRYGYKDIYELLRWRLYERTGGGLMAELGSHQLDAASIFLGKVHPLSVTGVGTKSFFGPGRNPREIDDHVFVTFQFPGKNHPMGPNKGTDKNDVVVVTYSSISTNGFEQYGECLMGTRGTLIVEGEQKPYLFKEPEPGVKNSGGKTTDISVTKSPAGKPVLDSGSTWGGPAAAVAATAIAGGASAPAAPISRGYREEMEDFAYCIRRWDEEKFYYDARDEAGKYKARLPRCHGEVAMADAIIALTSNLAMATNQHITFREEWFDASKPDTPEAEMKAKWG